MAFQVSAGINISEIDLTTVVPAASTTNGGIAGVFAWGPVGELTLVGSEVDLVRRFGKPVTNFNPETFFTAADFLAYSDALYVVRVNDGNTATPVTSLTAYDVSEETDYANTDLVDITAKYPGEAGNSLRVVAVTAASFVNSAWNGFFSEAPANTEAHFLVVDENGVFTGSANTILETYENVSLVEGDLLDDGTNNFIQDRVNNFSSYVKIAEGSTFADELQTYSETETLDFNVILAGGSNGSGESAIAIADLKVGYDLFADPESVDVSLIMTGKSRGANTDVEYELGDYIIQNIAEKRRDCIVLVSPGKDAVVNNTDSELDSILTFRNGLTSSSYGVLDSGYKRRYDKYNDVYTWTPLNGDIAGLCVRTDAVRDSWWSPAGYQRGVIKNVVKLAFNPNKAARDVLYPKGVNPVVSKPGQGTVLFGDKTLLARPSAFDRINVRRLFIVLQKIIGEAARNTLFEFNDEFTRASFVNLVEPFLRDVQGRRGLLDFRVVCDDTNNTQEVVDQNRFVADIYIKPQKSINFIQLNMVAVRSGVQFEEIVGQF